MEPSIYQTIPIDELKPGMLVHSIADQLGRLTVKSRGRINHPGVIQQLIASGVRSVVIERQKLQQKLVDKHIQHQQELSQKRMQAVSQPPRHAPVKVMEESKPYTKNKTPKNLKEEIALAEQLVLDCKSLYKIHRLSVSKGLKIDLSEAKAIANEVYDSLVRAPEALLCVSMIRNHDEYLDNHAMHVSILMCHFAQYLGMSEADCKRLAMVGYLFDIGMAKVPKEITHKMERPTIDEQAIIQAHVHYSLELTDALSLDNEQKLAIEQHHERLDGTGYPFALEGEQIHKYARMLSIVDTYDAMTTNRPFQKKRSPAAAFKVICNPEYGYDQKLAVKFLRCLGIYPVGSVVALSNKQLAIVTKVHESDQLTPTVKPLFSLTSNQSIESSSIDLASNTSIKIVKPVIAEHFGIDLAKTVIN